MFDFCFGGRVVVFQLAENLTGATSAAENCDIIKIMDQKTEKILQSLKGKKVGVFCDDSNLYHSYKKNGWRLGKGGGYGDKEITRLTKEFGKIPVITTTHDLQIVAKIPTKNLILKSITLSLQIEL